MKKRYIKTKIRTKDRHIRPVITTNTLEDLKSVASKHTLKKSLFIKHITPTFYAEYLEVRTLRKIYRYYFCGEHRG